MLTKKENIDALESFSEQVDVKGRSLWQDAAVRFRRNRAAMASLVILFLIGLSVIIGPHLSAYAYDATDWYAIHAAPSFGMEGHWFGTDALGRDLFTRTMMGGRISIMVGVMGALVAVLIGTLYGATSGFIGGRTDAVMMRMFFVIVLVTFFGRNIVLIFVAIGCIAWLDMARIVRGQTLSLRSKEFVDSVKQNGERTN